MIALVVGPLEEEEKLVLLDGDFILRVGLWLVVVGGFENREVFLLSRGHGDRVRGKGV